MLEIELKSFCENLDLLREKILKAGGIFKSSDTERDIYYRHPCRDFKKTDEAFRIRHSALGTFMTYKGPKIGEKTKTRFEIETPVASADEMDLILARLGFEIAGEVVKKRDIYKLSDITVCLDTVNGLGHFVELEIIGEDKDKSEELIFKLADKLGLDKFERRSYLELVLLNNI
jgi:adenylate cyclase, class 2